MDLELAKELKEAGYPQPLVTARADNRWALERYGSGAVKAKYYKPRLEELITACGDKTATSSLELRGYDGKWRAVADAPLQNIGYNGTVCVSDCDTPVEAVARLWIELQT